MVLTARGRQKIFTDVFGYSISCVAIFADSRMGLEVPRISIKSYFMEIIFFSVHSAAVKC